MFFYLSSPILSKSQLGMLKMIFQCPGSNRKMIIVWITVDQELPKTSMTLTSLSILGGVIVYLVIKGSHKIPLL